MRKELPHMWASVYGPTGCFQVRVGWEELGEMDRSVRRARARGEDATYEYAEDGKPAFRYDGKRDTFLSLDEVGSC